MPAHFAAVVAAARRTNDPGHFVREYTWSAFVVPFIWMAAAAEAHAQWPEALAGLCIELEPDPTTGLPLGAQSIRDAWTGFRQYLQAEGVQSMHGLLTAIRSSRGRIEACVAQDSRYQDALRPLHDIVTDDHFDLDRGARMENYIQEWLLLQAEYRVAGLVMILGANLQAAVMRAVTQNDAGLRQALVGREGSRFVQGANLVTGAGWRGATNGTSSSQTSASTTPPQAQSSSNAANPSSSALQGPPTPAPPAPPPVVAGEPPRRRRRGAASAGSRVFCPVPGCPAGDRSQAPGWDNVDNMRNHLEAHRLGQYAGDVPMEWLAAQRLTVCSHCNRLAVGPPGTMHRTCRAEARNAQAFGTTQVPTVGGAPPSYRADVERVLLSNRPTLHFVPAACRSLWSTALTRALAAAVVVCSPGFAGQPWQRDLAWAELMALPKAVLTQAPRSGRKHRRSQENHTRCLLQRWLDGEKASLWADAARDAARRGKINNSEAARILRATALSEEGKDSQACKTLVSAGLAPDNEATRRALEAKHPQGPPVPEELASAPAALDRIAEAKVMEALRNFQKGSAPGPSGLRAQHLLEAVARPEQAAALQVLTDVVNLLAAGKAPRDMAPHLAGATLVALKKDDADVRPIAIGEVWRRLTSKCICDAVRDIAQETFEPLQVGVACPMGLEAAVHTVTQYMSRHRASRNKLVLTIDFQNAFNTVSRSAFLRACRQHMPAVSSWAAWCYASPSRLLYRGRVVPSSAGVQQGDNLGPLFFAMAIHPLLRQFKAIAGIDVVIGYLDDIIIAGDGESVVRALRALEGALPELGLSLNLAKCELIPTAGADSEVDLAAFPATMKRVFHASFKFLGTPIGIRESVVSFTKRKRADKASSLLKGVCLLEDGQIAHKLLMRCMGSSRVMHAMRTTRPDWILETLKEVDAATMDCLEACVGTTLPAAARTQASLPIRLGGLGVRSAERHAPAAYVCSRVASRKLCQAMDGNFAWDPDVPGSGLAAAVALCNEHLPEASRLMTADLDAEHGVSQKHLSQKLGAVTQGSLIDAAEAASTARLRAAGAPHAGAWLAATPAPGLDQRMNHGEFVAAVKLTLGLPFIHADCWCPRCDQVLDRICAHAMACMSGGDTTRLHNSLRDAVYVKCLLAGLSPERERQVLLPDDPRRRPGDIYFAEWPGGQGIAMDFAVTSPLGLNVIHAASQTELAAATAYEATKFADRDTGQRCRDHGVRLVPMVAESLGGWGIEAQKAFKVIGRSLSATTGTPHGTVVAQLYEKLSVMIMRAAARSSLARAADAAAAPFCPAQARALAELEATDA